MASGSQAPSTFFSANPEFSHLALANADSANWTWNDRQGKFWQKFQKDDLWQQFADKWYNDKDLNREDPSGIMLDNLALPVFQDNSLMVRKCYVEAEKFIWKTRSLSNTGVILTGQPGIGKTLFIWYLLLRLLKMKQVVLLHAADEDVLFYTDGVYSPSRNARPHDLPSPASGSFIWFLFDLNPEEIVPACVLHRHCFPVQAPSPNQKVYNWRKQRRAEYTVFPLWTLDELDRVARRHLQFEAFSTYLGNIIRMDHWKDPHFLSTVSNPGLSQFLQEIFPEERPPESFDEAFPILLNGLVSRFGVIPRAVFGAMFENFNKEAKVHDSALTMSFEELQKTVDNLVYGDSVADVKGSSHRVISLNNVGTFESEVLQINFLSPIIFEKFSKRFQDESQLKVRSMIKHFLAMPQARGLAGSMFEAFAHRHVANPDKTDGTWDLRLMSGGVNSNIFVLYHTESPEMYPDFPQIKRALRSFRPKDLGHLYDDAYYIPTAINHPLFDSFVVDLDSTPPSLWLFQITISSLHKGSPMGYSVIEDIIKQIQAQCGPGQPLQAEKPDLKGKGKEKEKEPLAVEVNFVLVCPAGEKECKWVLPEGWQRERNVYFLELPVDHETDEVQKSDQKTRKRKASTSATPRRKQPPKKMKASTSATTLELPTTRAQKKGTMKGRLNKK